MINQPVDPNATPERGNPLRQVHEGMKVYDRNDREIGTVERVYLGELSPTANNLGLGPATARDPDQPSNNLVQDFAAAFEEDNIPQEMRERLQRMGFARVESKGLFSSDRYVLPEQIARVEGDRVFLKTKKDDLFKS